MKESDSAVKERMIDDSNLKDESNVSAEHVIKF